MTTYVLGAGASRDAGYRLAKTMAADLLQWMKRPIHDPDSYAARYPAAAHFLEESFAPVENVEDLVTASSMFDGFIAPPGHSKQIRHWSLMRTLNCPFHRRPRPRNGCRARRQDP